jgi:hypothetical protein
MDFSDYELPELAQTPGGVYNLADGVLREIGDWFDFILGEEPTEAELRGLIAAVGPAKTLQDNIQHVQSVLGPDAINIAAEWLEHSCMMDAVGGAFSAPMTELPELFDATIVLGGVANWQLRRMMTLLRLDPNRLSRVVWALGKRVMGDSEHQLVKTLNWPNEPKITEFGFCDIVIAPLLRRAQLGPQLVYVDSTSGDEVCAEAASAAHYAVNNGKVLVIGNAPSTIQSAGQFLAAARQLNPSFNENGDQLYMKGDFFPVARHGEGKDTHQHPLSGIGALIRAALFLHLASQSIKA